MKFSRRGKLPNCEVTHPIQARIKMSTRTFILRGFCTSWGERGWPKEVDQVLISGEAWASPVYIAPVQGGAEGWYPARSHPSSIAEVSELQ